MRREAMILEFNKTGRQKEKNNKPDLREITVRLLGKSLLLAKVTLDTVALFSPHTPTSSYSVNFISVKK